MIEHKDGVVALSKELGYEVSTDEIIADLIKLNFIIFNNRLNNKIK